VTPDVDTRHLADRLIAARSSLDRGQQQLALALYRLLAKGRPVSREQLARHAGTDVTEVRRLLDEQPEIHLDAEGRVVGFWGIAVEEMPHRMELDGRTVYAWGPGDPVPGDGAGVQPHDLGVAVFKRHFPVIIGVGGAVLIAMGVLIWTGELFQLNIKARHLLDSLGLDFFNHV
jgi:hypothetical protein